MINKNEWKKVKLEDIGEIITGITPSTSNNEFYNKKEIPFYKPNDLVDDKIKFLNEATVYISNLARTKAKIIKEKSVLVTCIGIIGKVAIINREGAFNQQINCITPNESICDINYLAFAIKSKQKYMQYVANSAIVPIINKTQFSNIEILLPNIETQKIISKKLNIIQKIIEMKQQQLFEFEKLVKFQFLKIFGDPILNEKNWKKVFLSDCCVINPKKNEIKLDDNFPLSFIGMADVSEKGKIKTSNIKLYKEVKNGFTYFKENDVLFAKITPCMENGKGGIAKNLYSKIGFGSTEFHVLRPIENISNSHWLYYLTVLPFFRKNAERNMTGSAGQKRVPITYFQKTLIALPPIELQNKFADFVKQVDKSKVILGKALKFLSFRLNYFNML